MDKQQLTRPNIIRIDIQMMPGETLFHTFMPTRPTKVLNYRITDGFKLVEATVGAVIQGQTIDEHRVNKPPRVPWDTVSPGTYIALKIVNTTDTQECVLVLHVVEAMI